MIELRDETVVFRSCSKESYDHLVAYFNFLDIHLIVYFDYIHLIVILIISSEPCMQLLLYNF